MVKKLFSFASSLEASKQVTEETEPRANFETKHNGKAMCTSARVRAEAGAARGRPALHRGVCAGTVTLRRQQQFCSLDRATLSGAHAGTGDRPAVPPVLRRRTSSRELRAQGPGAGGQGAVAGRPGLAKCTCPDSSLWSSQEEQEQSSSPGVFKSNTHVYTHGRTEITDVSTSLAFSSPTTARFPCSL